MGILAFGRPESNGLRHDSTGGDDAPADPRDGWFDPETFQGDAVVLAVPPEAIEAPDAATAERIGERFASRSIAEDGMHARFARHMGIDLADLATQEMFARAVGRAAGVMWAAAQEGGPA